ncbi:uncharacterized protein LOC119073987 [Bradysia coprophila]|uniref:uncharacterized protein LOC119073987 n=1 Tax=Bradysia coprophila TaxID=38358 RepID=UPI00187D85CB|nr:uncharacterized protein LOC119073987 [Bradysia coprophila]
MIHSCHPRKVSVDSSSKMTDALANFIENVPKNSNADIGNKSDSELLDLYQLLKCCQPGRVLTQAFIASIGKLDAKTLHSFVSRNGISSEDFKESLVHLIYAVLFSDQSESIKRMISEMPSNVFTRTRSPMHLTMSPTNLIPSNSPTSSPSNVEIQAHFELVRDAIVSESTKWRSEAELARKSIEPWRPKSRR